MRYGVANDREDRRARNDEQYGGRGDSRHSLIGAEGGGNCSGGPKLRAWLTAIPPPIRTPMLACRCVLLCLITEHVRCILPLVWITAYPTLYGRSCGG